MTTSKAGDSSPPHDGHEILRTALKESEEMSSPSGLATIGQVAEQLGSPLHRVEYVVASRGIAPAERVAGFRLFAADQVRAIAAGLAETASHPARGRLRGSRAART